MALAPLCSPPAAAYRTPDAAGQAVLCRPSKRRAAPCRVASPPPAARRLPPAACRRPSVAPLALSSRPSSPRLAKGFRGRAKNCIRIARERVEKALQYQFRDRKAKVRRSKEPSSSCCR